MAQRLSYLRHLFWWLGLIKNCPKCRSKLIRIDQGEWDSYKCSNVNCDFGKKHIHYPFEIWRK